MSWKKMTKPDKDGIWAYGGIGDEPQNITYHDFPTKQPYCWISAWRSYICPSPRFEMPIRTETLWFYRQLNQKEYSKKWCSGIFRPCNTVLNVEEEFETTTTREIAFNMPKVKYILYFVRRINHGDPSRSQWCKEWAPEGYIPDGIGTTCYKTTTEELR